MATRDLKGKTFGRLKVICQAGPYRKSFGTPWKCRCSCGTIKVIYGKSLTCETGPTRSCGCLHRELLATGLRRTHGARYTREYKIWATMRARCECQSNSNYADYGGRGISVCKRWRESFAAFLRDMGHAPGPRYWLERKDNSGNYEPGNCAWVTPKENNRNKRSNRVLRFRGQSFCAAEWAERLGWPPQVIYSRLWAGWTVARTLSTPVRRYRKRSDEEKE